MSVSQSASNQTGSGYLHFFFSQFNSYSVANQTYLRGNLSRHPSLPRTLDTTENNKGNQLDGDARTIDKISQPIFMCMCVRARVCMVRHVCVCVRVFEREKDCVKARA